MKSEFRGKTALVTGASRGIGAATAVALAKEGAGRVVVHYNGYKEGAEQTQTAVREAGAECDLMDADLSETHGIHSFIEKLKVIAPQVDILINNAGHLIRRAKLTEFDEMTFDRVMNLNVKSLWFISQAVVPHMIEQKNGIIINLSSIAARNGGGIGATIYAAAKGAVSTMTKGMAKELAPQGIRVNAVSPGTVDNDFHVKYSTKQMMESMLAQAPAGRLGTNEEISDTIIFLCSDAGRYIYGQTIEINGGMFMV